MEIIQTMTRKIKKFLSKKQLKEMAMNHGVIKRERKITAEGFLGTMIEASVKDSSSSLEFITAILEEFDITVSKQSLHAKMNESGVLFMKEVFEKLCTIFIHQNNIHTKFTDFGAYI